MRSTSTLALLAAAASTSAAAAASSAGVAAAETARNAALQRGAGQGRRLEASSNDFLEELDVASFCTFMSLYDETTLGMGDDGFQCTVGCDDKLENTITNCATDDHETCKNEGEGVFCITDTENHVIMGIESEFGEMSEGMCTTYTHAPDEVKELIGQRVCFNFMYEGGNMQGVIEDPNADLTQYSKISTCSASINGKTCRCDVCDHGQGVSLDCGGGLIQTCIEPTADMDSSVSLVRFTKGQHWEQNQFVSLNSASSAATSTIAATTTLAVLAVASLMM
jgi:hypothetical protein